MGRRRSAAIVSASLALAACINTAVANGEDYDIVAADESAAKAAVVHATDLNSQWSGGSTVPDRNAGKPCSNGYRSKDDDLVITGDAASEYHGPADVITVRSNADVMKTTGMAGADWHRSFGPDGAIDCLRGYFANVAGLKLVSFSRLPFPKVGSRSLAFRAVYAKKSGSRRLRVLVDFIAVLQGRTEISLLTSAVISGGADAQAVKRFEHQLVQTLAMRAHGPNSA